MKTSENLIVLRVILGGFCILLFQFGKALYNLIIRLSVLFSLTSQMWWLFFFVMLVALLFFTLLLLTWTSLRGKMLSFGSWIIHLFPSSKKVLIVLIVFFAVAFSLLALMPIEVFFDMSVLRWFLYWIITIFVSMWVKRGWSNLEWLNILAGSLLITGSVYRIFQFLPDISTYPFSLSWSEGSRFYYASLFFSEKIYGMQVPPSTLHPTRYLMQAVPFFIETLPLWFHRLWQVLLWLGTLWGTAFLLKRRLKIKSPRWSWIIIFWAFLFVWQGPIYYHLLVMVMIILWGFNPKRFWLSLFIVIAASAWAGISRLNWFPVPGMLAATLYFLEKSKGQERIWKYLLPPALWVLVGTGVALVSQSLYILWSGNDPAQFASSFFSDLLWYRLFPNSTYSLGVLTGAILVSVPVVCVLVYRFQQFSRKPHLVRLLGISAILAVLLLGGLVVSVKIGGGSNLHNLDAYLAILLVVVAYFYFGQVAPILKKECNFPPNSVNLLLILIPVFITLSTSTHFMRFSKVVTAESLIKMQKNINRALVDGGEVLFISERQLLTI